MKIGVFATFLAPKMTPEIVGDVARQVEDAGLDSLWVGEHVLLFDDMEFPFPNTRDGKFPFPPGAGMPDPVVTLAFLSSITIRLRLGMGIAILPQRNPVYTAKEFATLDWLSGGRVDFGVGIGWCKEEVVACGYTFGDRGERTNEALEMIKKLWTEDQTTYLGKHYQLNAGRMDPKPVQHPHIPIIVGGHSPAALKRAAKFGDGWIGFSLNPKVTEDLISQLENALAAAGRTREGFEIIVAPNRLDDDRVREFKSLGVDRLLPILSYENATDLSNQISNLKRYAGIGA